MNKELCPRCQELGYCEYENLTAEIMKDAADGETTFKNASVAIGQLRKEAEARGCPNTDAYRGAIFKPRSLRAKP